MSMTRDDQAYRVDRDDLLALRGLGQRLQAPRRRPARSALAGAHRSRFHGRGMDYRESRHYQPGDDIRNMDWRITARSGRPHVKVFDEERERPVVVLVDLSATMFFASQGVFKSVQAARLAALIGWSAIARGDRIGGLLFTDASRADTHQELSPAGGRRGQMRLIHALIDAGDPVVGLSAATRIAEGAQPFDGRGGQAGGLSAALIRLRRVARPGSQVLLLSDFYSADPDSARHLGQLARHCELHALQLADPLELAPPPPGRYGISDGRRRFVIDTRVRVQRDQYAMQLEAHQRRVQALTEAHGIVLTRCLTTDDPVECLKAVFAAGRIAAADQITGAASGGGGGAGPDPGREPERDRWRHRGRVAAGANAGASPRWIGLGGRAR